MLMKMQNWTVEISNPSVKRTANGCAVACPPLRSGAA